MKKDRLNVQAASLVLVNSAYSKESLYRVYGIFAEIGYLGVDSERFRPVGSGRRDFVLTVGALNPKKGFDFLIRSLAVLPEQVRPRLVIVSNYSDSREKDYITDLAESLNVHVTILINISDSVLVDLYSQAQLTLYAPIMEPFGFVPLESMACGTPVVAVNEAGVRETVRHRETGLLTERDPQEFAHAIAELLTDAARRRAYGSQARLYVAEEWQWNRSINCIERHLTRIAEHVRQ
jgi:glycosyltransferase involved in cell wall biosynthesis